MRRNKSRSQLLPNQSNDCNSVLVSVLDTLMTYYPPYCHRNHKYKWLLSVISIIFSVLFLGFTTSFCVALFYQDENSNKQKFQAHNIPYNLVVFFLHLSLAVVDKMICLYFCYQFDVSWYAGSNNEYRKEKAFITIRMIIAVVVWLLFFVIDCYLSLSFPAYLYFGWQMPWIILLILFHISYHLPAIFSQFVMSGDMLQTKCYLNNTSQSLQNLQLNTDNSLDELTEYLTKYEEFEQKRRLLTIRAYIVFFYTLTDIILIVLYVFKPIYDVSIFGYGTYISFHTIYSAVPLIEFMVSASRIIETYERTTKDAMVLRASHTGVIYEKLNHFVTCKQECPMLLHLFGVKLSWKATTWAIVWFAFTEFFLSSVFSWIWGT